jgi:hypothetical protein
VHHIGFTILKKSQCCAMASPESLIAVSHQINLAIILSILRSHNWTSCAQINEQRPNCKVTGGRNLRYEDPLFAQSLTERGSPYKSREWVNWNDASVLSFVFSLVRRFIISFDLWLKWQLERNWASKPLCHCTRAKIRVFHCGLQNYQTTVS